MTGVLYMVAVPIGREEDFSPAAREVLRRVDFIVAENKTNPYLAAETRLVPFQAWDRREKAEAVVARLLAGESAAFVADAGTPGISDPGVTLAALCHEKGVSVRAVPGCSALAAGISVSGIDCSRFCFEGFLSTNILRRREHLTLLAEESRTILLFEAPKKLARTLTDLYHTLGNRRLALCRDLSKETEAVRLTTLEDAMEDCRLQHPKGEYVLVVEGRSVK